MSRELQKNAKKHDNSISVAKSHRAEYGQETSTSETTKEGEVKSYLHIDEEEEREIKSGGLSIVEILALNDPEEATSDKKAAFLLSTLLEPSATLKSFYRDYWGKIPLYVVKNSRSHLKKFLSRRSLAESINDTIMYLGKDIELFTHSLEGYTGNYPISKNINSIEEAEVSVGAIWKHYKAGGIVRLLQPQKHHDRVWHFLSTLEIEFGSRVGCHVDIIPPSSALWGDLLLDTSDSFIVQMHGSSCWRIYGRNENSEYPNQKQLLVVPHFRRKMVK